MSPRAHVNTASNDLYNSRGHLSVAESHELKASHARLKNSGAPLSDAELATQLARRAAGSLDTLDNDRTFARALQETDGAERNARTNADVTQARRLQKNAGVLQRAPNAPPRTHVGNDTPNATRNRWWGSVVGFMAKWSTSPTGAAAQTRKLTHKQVSTAETTQSPRRPTGHVCVICQERIYDAEIAAPCGHYYDVSCFLDLFDAAMRDESLFPPRCCRQSISLSSMEKHLTQARITLFREKTVEFGTKKRVYCSKPTCSRFLCSQNTYSFWKGYLVRCTAPGCATDTCTKCKSRVTDSLTHTCATDQREQRVLTLGEREGWVRCPGCDQLIELNLGCYHMTCRCRTQFCYLCRALWRTCQCPQWDEDRLLLAAEARVDAQLGARDRQVQGQVERNAPVRAPAPPPARAARPLPAGRAPAPSAVPNRTPAAASIRGHPRIRTTRIATVTRHTAPPAPAEPVIPARTTLRAHRHPTASSSTTHLSSVSSNSTERARLVREAVAKLRTADRECEHGSWNYRPGGGRCETCNQKLRFYLFRCGSCQINVCNRCRRNRL